MVIEKHVCDALEWMYDNSGILTIRPGECCDGVVSPHHVTTVFYVHRADTVEKEMSPAGRLLGCVTAWQKFKDTVREIRIEEGFVEIGEGAFSDMKALKKISLPSTLTTIRSGAFKGSGLEKIVIPEGITELGKEVFRNCFELTEVSFRTRELKCLRSSLFENCKSLVRVAVPEGIRSLWDSVFDGCIRLEEVQLPESLREICMAAFAYCRALRTITLPRKLRVIEERAFTQCEALEKVTVPYAVKKVGDRAFDSCSELEVFRWYPNRYTIMRHESDGKKRQMIYKSPGLLTRLFFIK